MLPVVRARRPGAVPKVSCSRCCRGAVAFTQVEAR